MSAMEKDCHICSFFLLPIFLLLKGCDKKKNNLHFNAAWWQIKLTDPARMIYRDESQSWWSSSALFIPWRGRTETKGFSYLLANRQHGEAAKTQESGVSIACSLLDLGSLLNLPVMLLRHVFFWRLPLIIWISQGCENHNALRNP